MEKTAEGDKYLDFSDKTFEGRQIIRALSQEAFLSEMAKDIWTPANLTVCKSLKMRRTGTYTVVVYGDSEAVTCFGPFTRNFACILLLGA